MKIKFTSGTEIDTNKLSDRDAELHEAVKNLTDICHKYGFTSFLRVILNKEDVLEMQTIIDDKEKMQVDLSILMSSISTWVSQSTSGELAVVKLTNE